MHLIIADVTKSLRGTEAALIRRILNNLPLGASIKLTVFCFDSQRQNISSTTQNISLKTLSPTLHYSLIAEKIWEYMRDITNDLSPKVTISVYSFHSSVFSLQNRISNEKLQYINFQPWSSLPSSNVNYYGKPRSNNVSKMWPHQFMPIDEAIRLLHSTLTKLQANDPEKIITRGDLRAILSAEDARFSKTNSQANMPGLFGILVQEAVRRGIIKADEKDTSNPRIWLTWKDVNASMIGESEIQHGQEVESQKEAFLQGGESEEVVLQEEKSKDKGAELQSLGQTILKSKLMPESKGRPQQFVKPKSTSEKYITILHSLNLGPFSRIRPRLYDSFENIVNNNRPIIFRSLLSSCIDTVKGDEKFAEENKNIPWRRVSAFLKNLLARCPVVLDVNQNAIVPSFSTLLAEVDTLVSDWRKELDGELIIALIENNADISIHDLPSLTGALYLSREDEWENYVSDIISHLLRKGKIIESAAPGYRLEVPQSSSDLKPRIGTSE